MATTYIAKTQFISAAGATSLTNFYAYRAGICTYRSANYHSIDHHQITLALIPDGALPPLSDALEDVNIRFRDQRLLQMTDIALSLLLQNYTGDPVPLIMAGPQNYPNLMNQLPLNFFALLQQQANLPILYSASRTLSTGRTGMLEAIKLAQHYLDSGVYEQVIVGGIESCQHTEWLHLLDRDGRVKSESPENTGDDFVPGEGASFLLLTNNPQLALNDKGYRIALGIPGFGEEPGHIYSEEPYVGAGLDTAIKNALLNLPEDQKVTHIFSSMNGENYWAKEFGTAITRSNRRLDNFKHEHPAECYGDIGAATGGALITFAAFSSLKQSTPTNYLVYSSSDTAYRAAICVIPERISA